MRPEANTVSASTTAAAGVRNANVFRFKRIARISQDTFRIDLQSKNRCRVLGAGCLVLRAFVLRAETTW
jgi:hypothetical protein